MRLLLLLAALVPAVPATAVVYRWVDEEGNVVYSDQPHPGAERIEELEVQTLPAPPPPPPLERTPQPQPAPGYEAVRIERPRPDETIIDTQGNFTVAGSLQPPLQAAAGHRVRLLLDGKPVGEPGTSLSFSLTNIDRGTHTVQLEVVDRDGKRVAASEPVTFHLRRPFVRRKPS